METQENEKKSEEYFVNPYNFVPLEEKCERGQLVLDQNAIHTGYFECKMELLTPMFIPNTSWSQALCGEDERKCGFTGYDFFSYEDLTEIKNLNPEGFTNPPESPVIPGSEIRGAIRSVYEAAFNGCMSSVSAERAPGRRSPIPKKPGILGRDGQGGWKIVPCKRGMLNVEMDHKKGMGGKSNCGQYISKKTYDEWEEGEKLWIRLGDEYCKTKNGKPVPIGFRIIIACKKRNEGEQPEGDWIEGWLHKGEPFGTRKHHESVFYGKDKNGNRGRIVSQQDVECLKTVLEEYGKDRYPKFSIKNQDNLIYYCEEKDMPAYMSPACIGKEVGTKKIGTILKQSGGYQPCSHVKELCPACQVFGMVAKEHGEKGAVGSRVRFTDAQLGDPEDAKRSGGCFLNPMVLPELGEPKPGTAEFYTYSPYKPQENWKNSQGYWTYDYVCKKKEGNKRVKERLGDSLPKLRGRKFYWHGEVLEKYKTGSKIENSMQQRVRPLKQSTMGDNEHGVFRFRVYFENLTQLELERLRWSLDFQDDFCAHKIGRAKPLGFGSVRIRILDLRLRKINMESGENSLISRNPDRFLGKIKIDENKAISTVKLMTNWEGRPKDVGYPLGQNSCKPKSKNDSASHRWFSANRSKNDDANAMRPAFSNLLPKPAEEFDVDAQPSKRLKSQFLK